MKRILSILLLTCTSLWAQVPPPAGVPPRPNLPAGGPAGIPAPAGAAGAGDVRVTVPSHLSNLSEAELNKIVGKDEINFKAVTIDEFLTVYGDLVNRTILRPSTLPAPTITLRNQTQLTRREAIQLMDSVLGINGIAMINVGDKFVKAVPVAQANQEGAPFDSRKAEALPELGQYVTHVVQLKYVKPSEMLPILQPFAKIPNSILPIEANGILVIRDYAENVKRMLEMIAQVDVSVPAEFVSEVIPIKYALASDIASALNSLSGASGGTTVGSSSGGSRGSSRGRSTGFGGGVGVGGGMGGGMGGINSGAGYNPQGNVGGIGAQGNTGGTFTDRLRSIMQKSGASSANASGDITVLGETKIIADERTNSLLVYATRQDMQTIKDVVSKLDVVLAQVLIESIILSVSANDSFNFGVSASQNPKQFNSTFTGGGVANNGKDLLGTGRDFLSGVASSTNALSSIPASDGLSYFGKFGANWDVALQALASDGKTEVIQKPVIMTTHATPGHFFVGDTVPYVTSTYYGGGYSGPSSSYQQLRVGIDVQVTPFINPDGIVVMKIDQAIEQLSGSVEITGVGAVPTTSSRTLSADITVSNRDTIMLGGFLSSSGTKSKSGVPLLKDIPILGGLFRSTSNSKDRKELVVLMRPTVLETPHMAAMGSADAQENMPGIHSFQKRLKKEDKDFQNKMDRLDGIKPGADDAAPPAKTKADAAQTSELKDATASPGATPDAAAPAETGWTNPAATPPATNGNEGFKNVRPMTDEEIKALGRDTHGQ